MTETPQLQGRSSAFISKLIYGLLYPAYFGNMVYDIIQMFAFLKRYHTTPEQVYTLWYPWFTCIVILLYNALEYGHLYADTEPLAKKLKGVKEMRTYMRCDFLIPHLFFFAFVWVKHNFYHTTYNQGLFIHPYAAILIGGIPVCIFWYKSRATKLLCRRWVIAWVYLFIGVTFAVVTFYKHIEARILQPGVLIYIAIPFIRYVVFVVRYKKTFMKYDEAFYKKLRDKYITSSHCPEQSHPGT